MLGDSGLRIGDFQLIFKRLDNSNDFMEAFWLGVTRWGRGEGH